MLKTGAQRIRGETGTRRYLSCLQGVGNIAGEIGNPRAYELARNCAIQAESLIPADKEANTVAANLYAIAAHLALTATGNPTEARVLQNKCLTLRFKNKVGTLGERDYRKFGLWYFPKEIVTPKAMFYFDMDQAEPPPPAKPDNSRPRPPRRAPR